MSFRAVLRLIALLVSVLVSASASAHELRPGALGLQELEAGRFRLQWTPPAVTRGEGWSAGPRFPAHCTLETLHLDCGARGLDGAITFPGLEATLVRVVVYITYRDGTSTSAVVSAENPSLLVRSASNASARGASSEVAREYTRLGIEHILMGFDHLLFVLGLMLLVGLRRRLIATISAFTLAHSLTLAASVLGWANVPQAPVEAVIAVSILLLAVECSRAEDSLSKRAPWALAFSFGLLHGFGFAGALREIGLPPGQLPLALVFFNLGVELGQLVVIAAVGLAARTLARSKPLPRSLRTTAVYVMGTLAAYWSIERVLSAFALA